MTFASQQATSYRLVMMMKPSWLVSVNLEVFILVTNERSVHFWNDGEPPMRLATEKLLALPDVEQYSTDLPVEVDRGNSVIRSVGMDYDNIKRVVRFHSKVRGTFEAARAQGARQ